MSKLYQLYPDSGTLFPHVLHMYCNSTSVAGGSFAARCSRCKRLDIRHAAFDTTNSKAVSYELGNLDLIESVDYQYIVSNKFKLVVERSGLEVIFHQIPWCDMYFIMHPLRYTLPDSSDAYTLEGVCSLCGIPATATFGPGIPINLDNVPFGAVLLQGIQGPMPAWFASKEVATLLANSNLDGLELSEWIELPD